MAQVLKKGSKGLNLENWRVFNEDGKHMFTCGESKAKWYLDKDLAVPSGDSTMITAMDNLLADISSPVQI